MKPTDTPAAPELAASSLDDLEESYDVLVIGGAFAGSSLALLLRRLHPEARVLVVERSPRFERKVGEATVEVSGFFLHRILGLYDHLSQEHLPKHGLRYWFSDGGDRKLSEMTEVGPVELPRLPSFQLNRPVLDNHLLGLSAAEGSHVLRPAKVVAVDPSWPQNTVTLEAAGKRREIGARWIVDASGRQSFLARKLGIQQKVERHPTAAMWGRFAGVKDLDGPEFVEGEDSGTEKGHSHLRPLFASRRLATNHFCGYGWWCWVIPLSDGQTSIGLVYNKELFHLPGTGTAQEKFLRFLGSTPGLRELVADAELQCLERDGEASRADLTPVSPSPVSPSPVSPSTPAAESRATPESSQPREPGPRWAKAGVADFMGLAHLPYKVERYAAKGWALVGDAASFIDPYYSPGLDHAAISIWSTAHLLAKELTGGLSGSELDSALDRHNGDFERSYDRWLEALYLGKYEIFGDAELVRSAFLVDTALYYVAVVTPISKNLETFGNPIFGVDLPQATVAYRLTRAFNRRLRTLARSRRHAGTYGRANLGQHLYSRTFGLGLRSAITPLRRGLGIWLKLELEHFLHRLRHGRVDTSAPVAPLEAQGSPAPSPATAG